MFLRQLRHWFCRVVPTACLLVSIHLFCAVIARAHDPGLSLAEFRFEPGRLSLYLTFARADIESLLTLDIDKDGQVSQSEFLDLQADLDSLASEAIEIHIDGQRLQTQTVVAQLGESNAIHFRLEFLLPAGSKLHLNSHVLGRLPEGHRQFLSLRDERGKLVAERMLDAPSATVVIDLSGLASSATGLQSFREFLVLGVEHILTGYDHLVFLFGLLIVGARLSASVKIITSFTIAHSVTLALATLDVVRISPNVVEPLIAASIVYVGLENIFNHNLRWRWLLTFGFGLVHGFGFASVLRELGIGSVEAGVVIPLLSFNLGVELGQIAIAALALPLIWKLRTRSTFVVRYVPACSVLIALLGGFWLMERILPK
jgi:hydrogenase/urease accessory protein HupE